MKLAIEGGCNAVASTLGVLGCRRTPIRHHRIPFIVKVNHNELLTYPNKFEQIMFGRCEAGLRHGRGLGRLTTIYARVAGIGPPDRRGERGLPGSARTRVSGPSSGATCAIPHSRGTRTYHTSADLTSQANHLRVTIQADIIKQKLPDEQRRLQGHLIEREPLRQDRRSDLHLRLARRSSDRPDPLSGAQTVTPGVPASSTAAVNPRAPALTSRRGRSRTAVINKRVGGMGLLSGRKALPTSPQGRRRPPARRAGCVSRSIGEHRPEAKRGAAVARHNCRTPSRSDA